MLSFYIVLFYRILPHLSIIFCTAENGFDIRTEVCYCQSMRNAVYAIRSIHDAEETAVQQTERLSPQRQRRIGALSRREAMLASLTGDLLARELAGQLCRCSPDTLLLEDGPFGRPLLQGAEAHVSIAHSGGYAAAAASRRPVGVDLEHMRPISQTLMYRVCSDAELEWLGSRPHLQLQRFFRLWTMKEAYGKMLGVGIFSSRRFFAGFSGGSLVRHYPDCCFFFPAAPKGYAFAVCIAEEEKTI